MTKPTTHAFKSEEKMLLKLLANSIYSNREIFLRELLSNASDAMDKIRFLIKNKTEVATEAQQIFISIDRDANTLSIRDTGIGMSKQDLMDNLGTIAHSGTRAFLQELSEKDQKDTNLIGQFGIGFYSAFVVADQVTVTTHRAEQADTFVWSSTGDGEYTLSQAQADHPVGTTVTLHLKQDCLEFLESWRLRQVILKYSDHISWPILMLPEQMASEDNEEEKSSEWEQINQAQALWTLPKNKISEEQYLSFYSHISHDPNKPLAWTHKTIEGTLDYTMLLYIPDHRPLDLWHQNFTRGLKLYVKRVFIMDDTEQLLPNYLRFVRGVVDTRSLPLNVSREILQSSQTLDSIRAGCTKKLLGLLKDMATNQPERYKKFWSLFGAVIKEGVGEDYKNKDDIIALLCFASTHDESEEQSVRLSDYVARMQEGQDKIYFMTGESYASVASSPHLEYYKKQGMEVLILSDRVDEWLMSHLMEFDGHAFQDVTRLEVGSTEADPAQEEAEKSLGDVRTRMGKALESLVKEVRFTSRLVDSPARLVVSQDQMSAHLRRMLEDAGQSLPSAKPILEINPEHRLIQALSQKQSEADFEDWSHLLFEQALLSEGGTLEKPGAFVARMNRLMADALNA